MSKIIDSFIFYNELTMLDLRLAELCDLVDNFILVESTYTFAGNKKPLFFNLNKNRYQKYLSKIIHVIVDDPPQGPWDNEYHQRNCTSRGIASISLNDTDIILIADVDEIPDVDTLTTIKINGHSGIHCLEQTQYYYSLNYKGVGNETYIYASKVTDYLSFKRNNNRAQQIRNKRAANGIDKVPIIQNGGWHFSYFGGIDFIKNKIKNFAHQEFNNEIYVNNDHLEHCIESGKDLFNRPGSSWAKTCINKDTYLPKNYQILL